MSGYILISKAIFFDKNTSVGLHHWMKFYFKGLFSPASFPGDGGFELGNLVTWKLGTLQTCKLANLETKKQGNLESWKLRDCTTYLSNFF